MNPLALLDWFQPKNIKFIAITILVLGILFGGYSMYSSYQDLQEANVELSEKVEQTEKALSVANFETEKANKNNQTLADMLERNKAESEARDKANHKQRLAQQKREDKNHEIFNNLTDPYSQFKFARGMCEAVASINNDSEGYSGCEQVRIATVANLEAGEWLVFDKEQVGILLNNYQLLADYFKDIHKMDKGDK